MMWVEILSRHHDVLGRHRVDGAAIRIGRAYDNDVVLDDPFVAAHHLALSQNEAGDWQAQDLGSTNGLYTEPDRRKHAAVALSNDRIINIGRTYLRVRNANYEVAPERTLEDHSEMHGAQVWRVVAIVAILLFGIEALGIWNAETGEVKITKFLTPLLGVGAAVLIWTLVWALLSRLFAGTAQFLRHLRIALVGILVASIVDEVLGYAAYAFSLPAVTSLAPLVIWLAIAVTAFFHLRAIGHTRLWLKGALVGAVAVLAIALILIGKSENEARGGQPNTLRALKPPMFRVVPQKTEEAFFAQADALKAKLDRARTEEKPGESGVAFDFSD